MTNVQKSILFVLIVCFLSGIALLAYIFIKSQNEIIFQNFPISSRILDIVGTNKKNLVEEQEIKSLKIMFVGDMMLDRGVELLMEKNTYLYPFEKIADFFKDFDIVYGNLEGPINKIPRTFPEGSLQFSFSEKVIEGLLFANFDIVSLANNHTLNTGKEGFKETKEFLNQNNIAFTGESVLCDEEFMYKYDEQGIIFMGINKTFPFNCTNEEVFAQVESIRLKNPDDFIIMVMHWGNEYEFTNSYLQKDTAYTMIDAGADLIMGVHPHVIQNIELYKNKLIFYSLGNFILDQYFSIETQQSLAIGLEMQENKHIYNIYPVQSELAQPYLMEKEQADIILEGLADRSSEELYEQIKYGIIEIEK